MELRRALRFPLQSLLGAFQEENDEQGMDWEPIVVISRAGSSPADDAIFVKEVEGPTTVVRLTTLQKVKQFAYTN